MVIQDPDQVHDWIFTYLENFITKKPFTHEDYTIAQDMTVQIHVDCAIKRQVPGGKLPIHITHVDGDMSLGGHVNTLHSMPHTVTGSFLCHDCGLTSLQGGPVKVGLHYDCSDNLLMSLEGCAKGVKDLMCSGNQLPDLSTAPRCDFVYGGINPWKNFRHTPDHLPHVMVILKDPVPLLGLLHAHKIDCLDMGGGYRDKLNTILNKYAGEGKKGILNCALELKQAGLGAYAQW